MCKVSLVFTLAVCIIDSYYQFNQGNRCMVWRRCNQNNLYTLLGYITYTFTRFLLFNHKKSLNYLSKFCMTWVLFNYIWKILIIYNRTIFINVFFFYSIREFDLCYYYFMSHFNKFQHYLLCNILLLRSKIVFFMIQLEQ